MRISTFFYVIGQGLKNIKKNFWFSLASVATMSACIFLFGLFFSILINVQYIVRNAESNVSVTVFFDQDLDQGRINEIGELINARPEVVQVNYVSADDAWEEYKHDYFKGSEEAAEGFKDDNPLANSSNYSVYVDAIESQDDLVEYASSLEGVRKVNQSQSASQTLSTFNKVLTYVSAVIILVLLAVSVFLISNTISVGIAVRQEEIGIMKLIGATNFFVRSPFMIEGVIIGLIGAVIPLTAVYVIYGKVVALVMSKFHVLEGIVQFLDVKVVYGVLLPIGLILGIGIGFFGSSFSVRKHLRV